MILAVVGAIAGFCIIVWSAAITAHASSASNPYISTVYGGVIGTLIGYIVTPGRKKEDQDA